MRSRIDSINLITGESIMKAINYLKNKGRFLIAFVVRRCGYYTAQDMVYFAEWYRNASDWSRGNCGAAMFRLDDFKKGISSESF